MVIVIKSPNQPTKRSIKRRLDTLERQNESILSYLSSVLSLLHSLTNTENQEMATLKEVQDALTATQSEIAADADTARSAVTLIRRLIDMVGNAAASATDLDGLKSSLDTITTAAHASAQDLGDAVAAAPAP